MTGGATKYFLKKLLGLKHLGLWFPGLRKFFWKIYETLRPLSYILNVRSLKEYQKKRYQQLIQYKKEALQHKWSLFFLSIGMSEKTLKLDNIRVSKKEFHKSKQPIDLDLINVDQIVVSDKFKHKDDGFKYFIGYIQNEIVKLLCVILPQMTEYIKYFENGRKNMSFVIKDGMCLNR